VSSALVSYFNIHFAAELSISPSSRPIWHPSSSQGSTPTESDLVPHNGSVLLMQWNSEVDLARVAGLRAHEKPNVSTVLVSIFFSDALRYPQLTTDGRTRTSAYSLQPGARPIEVDSGGAEPDDATTTDANSICVIDAFLACTDGRINSLLIAQIRGLSALDVRNGRGGFPSTVPSLPIEVHRKGSIE